MKVTTATREYLIDYENAITTSSSSLYTAVDTLFNRKVAVKIISFDNTLNERELNAQLARAQTEISALSSIGVMTSSVPYLLDKWYDSTERKLYIFMQWITGDTLRKKMESGLKNPRQYLAWISNLVDVLCVMEKKRYYHNDIKPENIMIDNRGKLYLIDFNLTISNKTMHEGTPHYIAPELTEHIEARKDKADMFSLGVMLYEHFTNTLPRRGEQYGMKKKLFAKTVVQAPWDQFKEPIEINSTLNPALNALIVRLMKRVPSERFSSYEELKRELKKIRI